MPSGLRSPAFSITVPLRTESAGLQAKVLWWYLTVSKYSSSHSVLQERLSAYRLYRPKSGPITKYNDYLNISLWQDEYRNEESIDHRSDICISDGTFSVIQPNTEEILCKEVIQKQRCAINGTDSPVLAVSYGLMFPWHNNVIDIFLCNGTMTIQVDATLRFVTDPTETLTYLPCLPLGNVLLGMKKILSDGLLYDLTIKCGGEDFKAHKAVLASQSPVFRRMLESDMKEQRTNVIEISDVDQAVISDMLAYIYTGSVPNLDTLTRELLNVANKYELSGLFTMCERELKSKISLENVIELLQLADLLDSSYLKKACLSYISINPNGVHGSQEWKQNSEGHASLLMDIMDCFLK